jgi:hypothetical protein
MTTAVTITNAGPHDGAAQDSDRIPASRDGERGYLSVEKIRENFAQYFATTGQGATADSAVQPDDLAPVATSGAYGDLSGRPTLGTAAAQNVEAFATAAQGAKADSAVQPSALASVATSGAYGDLSGRPTLGTAAAQNVEAFATAAQGAKADSAVQPDDLLATVSVIRRIFVATAGQTVFSGNDAVGAALVYTPGNEMLFLNGVRLSSSDYSATNGTSITLAEGAIEGSILVCDSFLPFDVANSYTKVEIDAKLAAQASTGRNKLINALGLVNQRGYVSGAATTGANEYTLDRWRVVMGGQSLSWTTSQGVRTMTAPADGVEQVIEGSSILTGNHVLNWDGTATATVNGVARSKGVPFTLTGGVNVTVRFSSGTFAKPQLEAGAAATPFDVRHPQQELALCQRYYFTAPMNDLATIGYRYAVSARTGAAAGNCRFPVTMRAVPTLTFPTITYQNCSNLAVLGLTGAGCSLTLDATAAGHYRAFNTTASYIADAEI